MSRRGRRATLPGDSRTASDHGLLGDSGLVVRCYSQDGGQQRDFNFAELPASEAIRRALAGAFARRTAPATRLTSIASMKTVFWAARHFSFYLAQLAEPPATVSRLTPGHIDGFQVWRSQQTAWAEAEVLQIKNLLRLADGVSEQVLARCCQPGLRMRPEGNRKASYSREEFKQIADAARADLRAAAERIRANRAELARYRAGELPDPDRRLELMDFLDRHGDLPRQAVRNGTATRDLVQKWAKKFGAVDDVACWLSLTSLEAMAGAILLGVMTGQNESVLLGTPAAHHRADGHTGAPATAIVAAVKPRRGRRAHMTMALSQAPDWISIPAGPDTIPARDELHTPFGVYALLHELTASARAVTGSGKLFITWNGKGGAVAGHGLRPMNSWHAWFYAAGWSRRHHLRTGTADGSGPDEMLKVTLSRVRLTYAGLHQRPVAHTEQTLADTYLTRNRGNLGEYQKVVAAVLAEEVSKARVRGVMAQLTRADLAVARTCPETVASRHGVDAVTLKRMIAGELDTVMNACTGNESSPHAPAGQPCRASFMQCLGCPCARALPRHLPVQVLVHDQLEARRAEMTPLAWTQRFALPHAQLTQLLGQHDGADVGDARFGITDADRAVVARFLNRELDLR